MTLHEWAQNTHIRKTIQRNAMNLSIKQLNRKMVVVTAAITMVVIATVTLIAGIPSNSDANQYEKAIGAYKNNQYENALRMLRPFAELGYPLPRFYMAIMYQQGKGVEQDRLRAMYWFCEASRIGSKKARREIDKFIANQTTTEQQESIPPHIGFQNKYTRTLTSIGIKGFYAYRRNDGAIYYRKNPYPETEENINIPAHTKFKDDYIRALNEMGITDLHAFTDNSGKIYYGTKPNFTTQKSPNDTVKPENIDPINKFCSQVAMYQEDLIPGHLEVSWGSRDWDQYRDPQIEKSSSELEKSTDLWQASLLVEVFEYREALTLYEKWAEKGDPTSQYHLGVMYIKGQGVRKNGKKAYHFLYPLAKRGHPHSEKLVADMHLNGDGVLQDFSEAANWYKRAALQNIPDAQLALGNMYSIGKGVPQDYSKAHMWYNIAGANGQNSGSKLRDGIAKELTADQIVEAQKLARDWIARHGR
jgi:TPR repeat protein